MQLCSSSLLYQTTWPLPLSVWDVLSLRFVLSAPVLLLDLVPNVNQLIHLLAKSKSSSKDNVRTAKPSQQVPVPLLWSITTMSVKTNVRMGRSYSGTKILKIQYRIFVMMETERITMDAQQHVVRSPTSGMATLTTGSALEDLIPKPIHAGIPDPSMPR